ncbi:hypothetical protein LBMAG56_48220 [Verrucomicrobiota bacterium]|nr:hypothetical protein LBMAG56_48220 [Verrucomicrobiota bacterium]
MRPTRGVYAATASARRTAFVQPTIANKGECEKNWFNLASAVAQAAEPETVSLAFRKIVKQWKTPPTHRGAAALQFALKFGDRFASPPVATEKRYENKTDPNTNIRIPLGGF